MDIRRYCFIAFIGLAAVSCSDDIDVEGSGASIYTDAIVLGDPIWQPVNGFESRATDADSIIDGGSGEVPVCIIPLEGDFSESDSLYLYITVEDEAVVTASTDSLRSRTILADDDFYSTIALSAFKYEAGKWDGSQRPELFHNKTFKRDEATGTWKTDTEYLWPSSRYALRFCALAPATAAVGLSDAHTQGWPTLDYTVPAKTSSQISLLAATTDEYPGNYRQPVQLSFAHTTASISIKETEDAKNGEIKSLILENFCGTGTYNTGTGQWSDLRDNTTYTSTIYKRTGLEPGAAITDAKTSFTILPQTGSDSTRVTMNFRPYHESSSISTSFYDYSASLKGFEFEAGKHYSFKISTQSVRVDTVFKVTTADSICFWTKETGSFTVDNSLKYYPPKGAINSKSLTLTYSFYIYNEATGRHDKAISSTNLPWCKLTSISNGIFKFQLNREVGTERASLIRAELQSAPDFGSAGSPYNLSNPQGLPDVIETANTYIVNGPGTYSIPLVYGNAVKNGVPNTSLLQSQYSGNNYLGTPIAGYNTAQDTTNVIMLESDRPYIYDYVPENMTEEEFIADAELIWQTSQSLVTNVRLSDDRRSIVFDVPRTTIDQGDALISLKSKYGYLWSWNIWVTNIKRGVNDKQVYGDNQKNNAVLPTPVGLIDDSLIFPAYDQNRDKIRVVLKSPKINKELEFYIYPPAELILLGKSMIFEYGRVISLPPYGTCFNDRGETFSPTLLLGEYTIPSNFKDCDKDKLNSEIASWVCLYPKSYIKNLSVAYTSDLWRWRNTGLTVKGYYVYTKSIYDPCPPGYKLLDRRLNSYNSWTRISDEITYNHRFGTPDFSKDNLFELYPQYYLYSNASNKLTYSSTTSYLIDEPTYLYLSNDKSSSNSYTSTSLKVPIAYPVLAVEELQE